MYVHTFYIAFKTHANLRSYSWKKTEVAVPFQSETLHLDTTTTRGPYEEAPLSAFQFPALNQAWFAQNLEAWHQPPQVTRITRVREANVIMHSLLTDVHDGRLGKSMEIAHVSYENKMQCIKLRHQQHGSFECLGDFIGTFFHPNLWLEHHSKREVRKRRLIELI